MSKKDNKSSDYAQYFSPVKLSDSPKLVNKTANLTGNERQIKDGAADLHNITQKWLKLNIEGTQIIKDIANVKISQFVVTEDGEKSAKNDHEKLQNLCEQLKDCLDKMKNLVNKLSKVASKFRGVLDLVDYQSGNSILFQSWTPKEFVSVSEQLFLMYKKECDLKEMIYANICHTKTRDSVMFYTSAWLHQPYIDDTAEVLLLSILTETGHLS